MKKLIAMFMVVVVLTIGTAMADNCMLCTYEGVTENGHTWEAVEAYEGRNVSVNVYLTVEDTNDYVLYSGGVVNEDGEVEGHISIEHNIDGSYETIFYEEFHNNEEGNRIMSEVQELYSWL